MTAGDVADNSALHRYELAVEGDLAFAEYRDEGSVRVFTHTVVPAPLEGQGLGSRLVAAALEDCRAHGRTVRPVCAFVAAYMDRHPETRDLL
ncbi:GNAT family N-acetyltransferase [Sphingomonas morindae]|uniref:N-acetyltransferase n=1 Tax=Sphingomonas morindae TaxID=1541170 RepID=A0ABY4X5W5_9SPHN|nr:GNAT family N-acetyltransferase [Sphingomonas morindae]USI72274.1 N-acetyltransferase [Sphingomonas morindae]